MTEEDKEEREKRAKKERVLHARISESLDEEIKDHASKLGVSVSNLVRNVLQNTFGLVEDIVTDGTNIASAARRSAGAAPAAKQPASDDAGAKPTASPKPEILGWQEALLNLNGVCDRCNAILPKGTRAAIALFEGGVGPRTFRCTNCLKEEIDHAPEPTADTDSDES